MSAAWNVHISCFDDLDMFQGAVATIPPGVDIHVFDGRFADFDGDYDLTPGLEAYCADHPQSIYYHAPPAEALPFGDRERSAVRHPVHCKGLWTNRQLPADEWTLKFDTDDRLRTFDVDVSELDPRGKYCPTIELVSGRLVHVARLYRPAEWTPWVGDCLLPREIFPWGTPVDALATAWTKNDYRVLRFIRRYETPDIVIENYGPERPDEYRARRLDQLDRMGREDRFMDLKRELEL